jgi:hypothetical protein
MRRRNRKRVKAGALAEFWGEDVVLDERGFEMTIDPEALALMEERMILDEDVALVLADVREGAPSILERSSGLHIASRRVGNVTFWIKYDIQDGVYRIVSAWSHRMTVTGELS